MRINFGAIDAQCSPNTFLEVISPFNIYKLSRGSLTANLEGVNDPEALWLKSRYFVDACVARPGCSLVPSSSFMQSTMPAFILLPYINVSDRILNNCYPRSTVMLVSILALHTLKHGGGRVTCGKYIVISILWGRTSRTDSQTWQSHFSISLSGDILQAKICSLSHI